jgi:phage terminase large subunit
MKARKRVIQGGTSAGKTYAIIPIIIDKCLKQKHKATVVAETLPAVKEGALDIFKTIMEETGRWIETNWNASNLTYTFGNKSRIQFKSFDSEGKAKVSGKRTILFLNEANHIPFPIADALIIRSTETYIDFNPDNEFWAHTEILPEHNSEFLLITYKDNEGLSKETMEDLMIKRSKAFFNTDLPIEELLKTENIKSEYWCNWWKVYGLGMIGNLQGVVFTNWKQIDNLPPNAKLKGYGMDFGYTNDPTTLTAIYEFEGVEYWDEVIYQTGLLNSDIARICKQLKVNSSVQIISDSAEPKTIQELKNYGLNVKKAEKGKDSVKFGIQTMQELEIRVTSKSINLIKELRSYIWLKDKNGISTNEPIDAFNHCIDGIRYFYLIDKNPKSKLKAPKTRYV